MDNHAISFVTNWTQKQYIWYSQWFYNSIYTIHVILLIWGWFSFIAPCHSVWMKLRCNWGSVLVPVWNARGKRDESGIFVNAKHRSRVGSDVLATYDLCTSLKNLPVNWKKRINWKCIQIRKICSVHCKQKQASYTRVFTHNGG